MADPQALCPTCGQPWPTSDDGETLAVRMREPGVDCYQGSDGLYYLTRTRNCAPVSRAAIDDALAKGLIVPKWPDAPPAVQYWRAK